mmetsp:Transcript_6321/g.19950  ORF Transcript_6321/g.19950 Transcript_6321/m.19950 type:complete len:365 (+) Transcript_6321:179-1273(+)
MISPYFGLNLPPLAPPAPPCIQAASVLFFAAALFGDQLVVRILLALAYGALALEGSVVALARDDWLENDTFFWAVLTGGLHAFAFSRLYREARANGTETEAEDPDAAALERFLRRRTGASATDARRLREIGRRVSYAPNDIICRTSESREHLYLVVEGVVRAEFKYEGDALVRSIQLASGEYFDLRILNLAGVYIGFPNKYFEATAETSCACFRVATADLVRLCHEHRQFRSFLRILALDELSRAYEKVTAPGPLYVPRDSRGVAEAIDWGNGARSRDFTNPYDDAERKRFLTRPSIWKRLRNAWAPFVQPGCLNTFSPLSGEVARRSVEEKTVSGLLAAPPPTPRMPVRLNSWYTQYERADSM